MAFVPAPLKRKFLISFAVALLALAALVGLLAREVLHSRETLLAAARQENLSRSRSLVREVQREFEKLDVLLREAASEVGPRLAIAGRPGVRAGADRKLAELLSFTPESQSLRIADRDGRFVFDASGQVSDARIDDREYFLRQKQQDRAGLVISEPLLARITHNWVLTVSRPIYDAEGHFAGVVQTALNADYFTDLLRDHQRRPTDVLSIIGGSRQVLIARVPELASRLGVPIPASTMRSHIEAGEDEAAFEATSGLDGVVRSMAYHHIGLEDLTFVYARGLDEILAPWHEQVLFYGAGTAFLFLALVGIFLSWRRGYLMALDTAGSMQDQASKEAARLRTLIDSLPDLIWIKGPDLRFQAANLAFARTLGRTPGELIDALPETLFPESLAEGIERQDRWVLAHKETLQEEYALPGREGGERIIDMIRVPILDGRGEAIGVAGIGRDVTERKHSEAVIRHMAEHDPLTDLPNRLLLSKRVAEMMAERRGEAGATAMAVLFVDLDEFKRINDTLGHEIGDRLLQQVGRRLQETVFANDIVSRHGGDEFTVLLLNCRSAARTAQAAERILARLAEPFQVDGHELSLTASVGIALYPEDGRDLASLLRSADTAMYSAKAAGRNTYRFFTAEMNTRIAERLALESSLRKALERDELHLHFQPQVDLASGRPVGFEALVRWSHPERGPIPPDQFIPVAEESRLILPIGRWIMEEACRAARTLQAAWDRPLRMAINLSAVQFRQDGLGDMVQDCLEAAGLDPADVELELTESILIQDFDHALAMMTRLKALGLRLAIDDFGTGFSSLSYLRRLPFDTLKIDKSFVRDLEHNGGDRAIAETIIAMGSKLDMDVLAEGVETGAQRDFLAGRHCGLAQGFLFGRPMPLDEAVAWLEARAAAAA